MNSPFAERVETEREFHDDQARRRAETLLREPDRLRFSDREYLDHESWIRPAWRELGPLVGRRVLDYGCGHGMAAIVLARHGARVSAFDLSPRYVEEARLRATANDVHVEVLAADAHHLPFADAEFDAVWGNAVLHHLDLRIAGRELLRVLRPQGVAVFCEPWGANPLLRWARRRLPYHGKHRTPDEEPLRREQLNDLRTAFPNLQWRGFQLLSMVRRAASIRPFVAGLDQIDRALLPMFPFLQNWCRYVVLTLRRD